MISLSPAISVPNINRIRLRRVQIEDGGGALVAVCEVGRSGLLRPYFETEIRVENGSAQGVAVNPNPEGLGDLIVKITLSTLENPAVATAGTDAVAAYFSGGATAAAKTRGLETFLQGLGLLLPGSVT